MASCDICLELFDSAGHTPRILPCGHSICESCLTFLHIYSASGVLSQNSPQCPKCRTAISVPTLSQLPKNFSLMDAPMQSKALLCPQHSDLGLQALLFCLRCGVYVCHKCIATSHNAHQFEDLEKRAAYMKNSVERLRRTVGTFRERQEKELREYERKRGAMQQSHDQANESVRGYFESLRKQLNSQEEVYLQDITQLYKKDYDDIDSMVELTQTRIRIIERVMKQWEQFEAKIETMSEKEILLLNEGNSDLIRLTIESASVDFQQSPEYHVNQYKFSPRKDGLSLSDLGVISQEGVGEYLLMLGASALKSDPEGACWILSVSNQTWESIDMEVDLRAYSSACFLPDFQAVVITGGKDHPTTSRSTQILYPSMRKSDTRSLMQHPRAGHSSIYFHNFVYVFGGFNEDAGSLESCERFDFVNDHWEARRPMHEKRAMFGTCVLDSLAFVFGGHAKRYLSSIEKYMLQADRWVQLGVSLPYSAAGIAACPCSSSIFLLGGLQGSSLFAHAHIFDPEKGELQLIGSLREARAFAKAFCFGARVVVLGGGKGFTAEEWEHGDWREFRMQGDVRTNAEKFACVAMG